MHLRAERQFWRRHLSIGRRRQRGKCRGRDLAAHRVDHSVELQRFAQLLHGQGDRDSSRSRRSVQMSEDASVTKDLIQTAKDGQEGYAKGADKLADSNAPDLAATFREYSEQR